MAEEKVWNAGKIERGVAPDFYGLEAGGAAAVWNDSYVHGFHGLACLLRVQIGGRPEDEEGCGEIDRSGARSDEPCAQPFPAGAYVGRSIRSDRRFSDEGLGGLFRDEFLSKIDGGGTQLDAEPARPGDGLNCVDNRGARILRRGIAERLRSTWNNDRIGSDLKRSGDVDLGDGIPRSSRD